MLSLNAWKGQGSPMGGIVNITWKRVCRRAVTISVAAFAGICIFQSSGAAVPPSAMTSTTLKRYVAFTDAAAAAAVSQGAKIVLETRGMKALLCPPAVAGALGLALDIPIKAADSAANAQVLATRLQGMGLTGKGRKVVVLDTGYNYVHPELSSSYLGGWNWIQHTDDPFDDNGHGSHVAGIITGDGIDPRARGIAPNTGIVAGKVLDQFGNGFTSDLVAAIYWAVDGPDGIYGDYDDFQPDAINISIGSTEGTVDASGYCDSVFPRLTYAMQYAVVHGVPVVVAAGNFGTLGVSYPGCISYAMAIGAVTASDVRASFSGVGASVALVAPGVGLYSSFLGAGYATKDGTSQATPVVTGTIALLKEAFPNASMSDLQKALITTAADLGDPGKDQRYGWGRVHPSQALGALTTNMVNLTLSLTRSNNHLVISWPLTPPGFVLQATARCKDTAWTTVTNPVVILGNQQTTVFPLPSGCQFYRLSWP